MGLFGSSSADKASEKAAKLAKEQFQWQKDQAAKAEAESTARRAAMTEGLGKIGSIFSGFDDPYYQGIQTNYLNYANPQIAQSQERAQTGLRSALANKGKLHSSTDASQQGELATTFGGIFRDAQTKSLDYANQQRNQVLAAKQNSIAQMYGSESPDVGLQAASGAVGALQTGPAFEPISALLGQAARYATMDYNNSLWNGQSYGAFSPMFNNKQSSPTGGGSDVKVKY
jgi:hypothetical protein